MAGFPINIGPGGEQWKGRLGTGGDDDQSALAAGDVLLVDVKGRPLVRKDKGAVSASGAYGLPVMGLNGDILRMIRSDRYGGQEMGFRRRLLSEAIEGATLNTQRWTSTLTTMTITQAAATGIVLNGSAITTINTGALLSSRVQHGRQLGSPLQFNATIRSTLVANQVGEWGFGHMAALSATAAQVEQGAFWRFTSSGSVVPVIAFNGSDVVTGSDISVALSVANYYDWSVFVDEDRVTFICTRSDTGAVVNEQTLRMPVTQAKAWATTHIYTIARVRNTGSAPASAGQLMIGELAVDGHDLLHNIPWDQQLAENMGGAHISPLTYAQASQFANSAAPASATLSNTAAGYTTLGGMWQFANLAGAATDYNLFGFTIPAPYRLKIKGIHIAAWNTGAANAATPATMLMWGLGLNGASVNLSSGGHIRKLLGQTTIPISAAIGAAANDIDVSFPEPLVCEPGTSLAVILRVVAGAATASQIIQGLVDIRGVFE